mmetsp:Transcript_146354/g.258550  ORF Transcript_146354/g.258550 Transcript_146354/m.258550 type:complete len:366 (-) Transcript_146354:69-1166(-)
MTAVEGEPDAKKLRTVIVEETVATLARPQHGILGIGNPLLDISDNVTPQLLEKYGLDSNNAILAEEKHLPLYKELAAQPSCQYIAGGATQNSIRVAQWMMQQYCATAYMGCVGDDDYAQKMRAAVKGDGVEAIYMVDKTAQTGTCAVCITGNDRSLVANLGAANNFKLTHLRDNETTAKTAKVIYSAGFFITVSPETIEVVSTSATRALYCMNLSAPFLMQVPPFKACFVKTMPYVDFLFGNEAEAITWAETEGWDTKDVSFIATRLSLIPMANAGKHRHIVITQGTDPTIVAHRGKVKTYPIVPTQKEKIVDTNGAGDAYVGGFLAGLEKGMDIQKCHDAGAYAASVIIQRSGCTLSGKPDFKW